MSTTEARVVLVTGGTRGIGAAIVQEFLAQGAEVIATGTDTAGLRPPVDGRLRYIDADFSDADSLRTFCAFVENLPRLDVCVNNAGINIIKPLDDVVAAEFDRLTAINFRAPYLISQAAARVMRRAHRGWIINLGSVWSVITKQGRSQYTAAKTGVVGITRGLAIELAGDGILVNCVSPGFVRTDMTKQSLSPDEAQALAAQVPLGRMAEPVEIARLIAFLSGPQNTYITGQNIVADGGFTNV